MAQKCGICKEKVENTFLQKPLGTWMRDEKGKKHLVCQECQRKHDDEELRQKL